MMSTYSEKLIQYHMKDEHSGEWTVYFRYLMSSYLKDRFKNALVRADTNHEYNRRSTKSGVPPQVSDACDNLWCAVFSDELSKLESLKKEWKKSHIQYYRNQISLPTEPAKWLYQVFDQYNRESKIVQCDTIADIIQGYKAANAQLKNITNDDLTPFCTEIRTILNIDHRDEYDSFVQKSMNDLGIPDKRTWIQEHVRVPEREYYTYRLSLDRKPLSDSRPYVDAQNLLISLIQ